MTEFRPSRFEILPSVVKNILLLNVLVFFAQKLFEGSAAINFDAIFALHNVKSPLFKPWQIITHMFMHGGYMHIAMNMFMLWMFGSVLENIWGPKRFLTFYFLCGIGAALLQLTWLWFESKDLISAYMQVRNNVNPANATFFFSSVGLTDEYSSALLHRYVSNPTISAGNDLVSYATAVTEHAISQGTVGASGAIFGVVAAFVYLFPNTYLNLYFLFPIKAKWFGLCYFGYELFSAMQRIPGDNIAHWAHVGGGLVGFLLVLTWNKTNRRQFY